MKSQSMFCRPRNVAAGTVSPSDHHQVPLSRTVSRSPSTSRAIARQPWVVSPSISKCGECSSLQVGGIVPHGAFPNIGARGVGLVVRRLQAPVVGRDGVGDVEVRLDRLVVAHHFAPEDLLAEVHLPAAGQLAAALHLGLGDDLVPAVLRIAEEQRPDAFQADCGWSTAAGLPPSGARPRSPPPARPAGGAPPCRRLTWPGRRASGR